MKATTKRTHGFTLIELLVVIAIIAILAAILVPAVQNALLRGKLTQTMSNGRNIYVAIFQASMANPLASNQAWPQYAEVGSADRAAAAGGWPRLGSSSDLEMEFKFLNTDTFFVYMVTSGALKVGYEFFSAPGMNATKGNDRDNETTKAQKFISDPNNNAWAVTADVKSSTRDNAPVIFTKNIRLRNGGPLQQLNQVGVVLHADHDPFQDKGAAVVLKGGAAFTVNNEQMVGDNNKFNTSDEENRILYPNN